MLVKKCGFKKIKKAQGQLPRIERLDVHHHIREKTLKLTAVHFKIWEHATLYM